MADLRELHAALASLAQSGKTAKVSYYYTRADDLKMHSGSISVDSGARCRISHLDLAAEEALEAIAALNLAKVATLPAVSVGDSGDAVPIALVLDRLDPEKRLPPAPAPGRLSRPRSRSMSRRRSRRPGRRMFFIRI